MKVMAKHWLNYNGVWHKGGDVFEVEDFEQVKEFAEPAGEVFESEVFPPEPKRRGRQKKAD